MSIYLMPFGNISHDLPVYRSPPEEKTVNDWLKADQGNYKVAILPPFPWVLHSGYQYPSADLLFIYPPKPALSNLGGLTSYDDMIQFNRFLAPMFYKNETQYLGRLLSLASVKYVIANGNNEIPQVFNNWNTSNAFLSSTLSAQKDLTSWQAPGVSDPMVSIFQNQAYLDRLYAPNAIAFSTGDKSVLTALTYDDRFPTFSNTSVVFATQVSGSMYEMASKISDFVVVNNNNLMDLALPLFPQENVIKPGLFARTYEDTHSGWANLALAWYADYNYGAVFNPGDGAVTNFPDTLAIPYSSANSDLYDIYLEVHIGPSGSAIDFKLDNVTLTTVRTESLADRGFQWVQVPSALIGAGTHHFQITNLLKTNGERGENAVLDVIVAPTTNVQRVLQSVSDFLAQKKLMLIYEGANLLNETGTTVHAWNSSALFNIASGESFSGKLSLASDGLVASPFFSGGPNTSEGITIDVPTNETLIDANTHFRLSYQVGDARSQWLEVAVGLDFNGNGTTDGYAPFGGNYPPQYPAPVKDGIVDVNVLDLVKRENGKSYHITDFSKIRLSRILLRLNKWTGIDLSGANSGYYPFTIKDLTIFETPQIMANDRSASQGYAVPLPIRFNVDLPKTSDYALSVRFKAGKTSNIQILVDQRIFNISSNGNNFSWSNLENLILEKGAHSISLIGDPSTYVDLVTITDYRPLGAYGGKISFAQTSLTDYTVSVDANRPFVLVFTDNFDNNWEALDGASILPHVRVNSFENGFYVDRQGQFTLRILFAGQDLRTSLVILSFLGTGLILTANLIPYLLTSKKLRFRSKTGWDSRLEPPLGNNGSR